MSFCWFCLALAHLLSLALSQLFVQTSVVAICWERVDLNFPCVLCVILDVAVLGASVPFLLDVLGSWLVHVM